MSRADLWQFLFSIIKTLVDYWSCSFVFSLAFLDPGQGGMCSMGGCSTNLALHPGRLLVQGVQYQGERSDDSPLHSIWWDFREGTWSLKVKVVGFHFKFYLVCRCWVVPSSRWCVTWWPSLRMNASSLAIPNHRTLQPWSIPWYRWRTSSWRPGLWSMF